jgi:uncharacterized protein (TIGR00251 family)
VPLRLRRDRSGAVLVEIVVTPRSSRDALLGEHDGALRVAVTAPPVEGAANKAICSLVAKGLGVPKSAVQVAHGQKGRRKTLSVAGVDEAHVQALITP